MSMRISLLMIFLATWVPSATMAGEAIGVATDQNSELALRLFAERERMRDSQLSYAIVYPAPGQFSAQALEQQHRAMLYWLWQSNSMPPWLAVPYWPPVYPMGWPINRPWIPPPVPVP